MKTETLEIAERIYGYLLGFYCHDCDGDCLLCRAKKLVELLRAEQWVPVSERLPEKGAEVLFVMNSADRERCIGTYGTAQARGKEVFETEEGWCIPEEVDYWRPLPEVPK